MLSIIRLALKNKIVWYVLTRYMTYGIQFVVSMFCAAKMGPYYFGMWSFLLLLLNYMQQINFGISNSANILLVQERNNHQQFAEIESTSFFAQSFLCIGVLFFAAGNAIWGYGFMEKYPVGWLFYLICGVAILAYLVQICMTIYRVKHQLVEIAFSQSSVPLFTLIALFLATGKELLMWFGLAYLSANTLSLIVFVARGKISLKVMPTIMAMRRLMTKGFFLFFYNSCFYLIIITTRTVVSTFYRVEEFGYFSFALTLADAVMLLLGSISFLLFPKAIEKLHSSDLGQIKNTISILRINYMTTAHGLMYFAFMLFPIITMLIPKYHPALAAIYIVAMALLTNTINCGYPDYLMAHNKDRQLAMASIISLIVNAILSYVFAVIINCSFKYVIISTIVSYWVFSVICIAFVKNDIGENFDIFHILATGFPLRLLIPFCASFLVVLKSEIIWLLPMPFVLFLLFNYVEIKEIAQTLRRLISNPNMLDVNGL